MLCLPSVMHRALHHFVICKLSDQQSNRFVMSAHKRQKTENSDTSHCTTRFFQCKGSQIWKIKGFLTKCHLQNGECLESLKFPVPGCESNFFMRLYPKGITAGNTGVSLYLVAVEGEHLVTCEFALVNISGRKQNKKIFSFRVDRNGKGFDDFISREELDEQKFFLLQDDQLTASCVVTVTAKPLTTCEMTSCHDPCADGLRNHALEDWASLFDQKHADVVLKVGNETIPAHKTVLCRSPVFAQMFQSDMQGKNTTEVKVDDVEREVLVALLSFLYSDQFSVQDVGFALNLLVAAHRYVVESLKSRCIEFLSANLSAWNAFAISLVADAYHIDELSRKCMDVIDWELKGL